MAAVLFAACGPVVRDAGRCPDPPAPSSPGRGRGPGSVELRPDVDDRFLCIARITHDGEAGSTFGFSPHEDRTDASREARLSLDGVECTFGGRYEPRGDPYLGAGVFFQTVHCAFGGESLDRESREMAPISFSAGDAVVRFWCEDLTTVRVD